MKRKYIYYFLILFAISLGSCTEKKLNEINENPNNLQETPSSTMLLDAQLALIMDISSGDMAFYASLYNEYNVGVDGQFYNAEIRQGEPSNASTMNNVWENIYGNLRAYKIIQSKFQKEGSEYGNYLGYGISEILKAYCLSYLTDGFGDIPWEQALNYEEFLQPKLDKQKVIYQDIMEYLDHSIKLLNDYKNSASNNAYPKLSDEDIIYHGDPDLWIKTAYALKARYTLRLLGRSENKAEDLDKILEYVSKSYTSENEEFKFDNYNTSNPQNPFAHFLNDRGYFAASSSLHSKFIERNDPREPIQYRINKNSSGNNGKEFAPNGTPEQDYSRYYESGITSWTAATYLMSYNELMFIKAEALTRKNNDKSEEAIEAVKDALNSSITRLYDDHNAELLPEEEQLSITRDEINTYVDDVLGTKSGEEFLKELIVQKYLSLFESQSFESYCDYRRVQFTGPKDCIKLENPNKFPLRYAYGLSDVTSNKNISNIFGDGTYVYTEPVWWAGGTR